MQAGTKPIYGLNRNVVGSAPIPQRPSWLPKTGKGQSNVKANCWSLTIEQWVYFVKECAATSTWDALVKAKGEYNINMYDVNDHFVIPWTKGTGSSLALLMREANILNCSGQTSKNDEDQLEVELMISHAWGGSVVETYNCMQNLVNHHKIPRRTNIFFCTFCLYQVNDVPQTSALGGLSIPEQLKQEPFAQIIQSEPKYGMYVVHTTLYEVYGRMWTVHEVDECTAHDVEASGLFDMYRWSNASFEEKSLRSIDTRDAECRLEDKEMLVNLIKKRGGFDRLNAKIKEFRMKMRNQLQTYSFKFPTMTPMEK